MNLRLVYFISFFFLGYSPLVLSQEPSNSFGYKNLTIEEGLSQNSVVDIVKDSLGFMWFATRDGLNRFDGDSFKKYPGLFDLEVNEKSSKLGQLQIYGNTLWMITKGGKLEKMDLLTEEIIELDISSKNLPPARAVLVESPNRIWYGTENKGVFLLDAQFEIIKHYSREGIGNSHLVSNTVNRIYKDSYNIIWILTNKGLHEISKEGNIIHLKNSNVTAITQSRTRVIWIGTKGDGMFVKEYNKKSFLKYRNHRNDILNKEVLIEDLYEKDYKLWIGTYDRGLYILDLGNGVVNNFRPDPLSAHSIGSKNVLTVFADDEGGVWVGMDRGGISYFNDTFKYFKTPLKKDEANLYNQEVGPIVSDTLNNVWFITNEYLLNKFNEDTNELKTYDLRELIPEDKSKVNALYSTGDELWLGLQTNGISRFHLSADGLKIKENKLKNYLPGSTRVTAFLKNEKSGVFAGTNLATVFHLDENTRVLQKYKCKDCKGDEIATLAKINDSTLAVGFKNSGLRFLNTHNGLYSTIPALKTDCFNDITITSLYFINDWLWAGTSGKGIWAININNGKVKNFRERDGLPSNLIYGILPEDSRQLWVSTNKGLFNLTYKKINGLIEIDKIKTYTRENGLQSNEFSSGSFHLGRDNTLYFGGIKGVNYFKVKNEGLLSKETKVYISEVFVENQLVKGHLALQKLNLPFSKNSFAVNYSALDFITPSRHIFSYRLEGYDNDWIEAGGRKYVSYNNLPPGDYNFQVKLSEKTLDYAPVTSFGIIVNTPFWYTWWFIVLAAFSFFLFLYVLYRYRLEHILELQKTKDRISADLHDDLGARLTTIHFISAISRNRFSDSAEISTILSGIDREINASTEALDEIVWNIRKADESFGEIIAKIIRYISDVLESEEIQYEIEIDEEIERNKFSMEKKREFFLICKELVNNVRKHSGATHVIFQIKNTRNFMTVYLKDNGQGFNPSIITHRNGLSNIKKRVLKWKGKIKVISEPGKGAIVVINIPLNKSFSFIGFMNKLFKISPKKGIETMKELA